MPRPILLAGLLLGLAACASEPPRGRHGPPPGAMRLRRGLFISPSGEPFRGGDGLAAWLAGADADHDGAITLAEFQADAMRFFRVLDANGDGQVDGFEMQAYEQTIAPEIAALDIDRAEGMGDGGERRGGMGGGGRRGGPGGRRGDVQGKGMAAQDGGGPRGSGREGAARYSLINEPEPVTNADEDLDGRISRAEWMHASLRRFTVLDKGRTGRLTLDSLTGKAPAKR